jgi:hypothetical protein
MTPCQQAIKDEIYKVVDGTDTWLRFIVAIGALGAPPTGRH